MIMHNDDMRVLARRMYLVHNHHPSRRYHTSRVDYDTRNVHTSRMSTSRRDLLNRTRC